MTVTTPSTVPVHASAVHANAVHANAVTTSSVNANAANASAVNASAVTTGDLNTGDIRTSGVDTGDAAAARLSIISQALSELVSSPQPAIVLASLAGLCVPAFSDHCAVELQAEDGSIAHLIRPATPAGTALDPTATTEITEIPMEPGPATVAGMTVIRTGVHFAATAIHPAATGTVIHCWAGDRRPDALDAVLATMAVERASAVLEHQRLAGVAEHAVSKTEQLKVALQTNRQIGAAIGILMASYRITEDEAFARLRKVSQNAHIKLRELADEVVRTGCLT